MRTSIRARVLLVGACLLAGASAWGQQTQDQGSQTAVSLDGAVIYSPLMANVVGGHSFWMQGGSVQVHGRFWRGPQGQRWSGLGIVADISGLHSGHVNGSGSGLGLDIVTATFGPRYTWSPENGRYALFGEVLTGVAHGSNSLFPTSGGGVSNANSLALDVGGGANVHLRGRLTLRAFEADWLYTQLPNANTGAQNSFRVGAGVIYKFK